MAYGDASDMYLSKKCKGKWSASRFEQRKEKLFGKNAGQENVDKITLPLKVQQATKRGEVYHE